MNTGWGHRWVLGREVFTDPQGTEWVRATPESATLCYLIQTPGVPHLYLKPGSAARLHKLAARKARRLEKRTRRLTRRHQVIQEAMADEYARQA